MSVSPDQISNMRNATTLLNSLKEKMNLTYLFISHDLAVVKFMSDRIMVMNKGKIEEIGLPEEIYNNPRRSYTKTLVAATLGGALEDIRRQQNRRGRFINCFSPGKPID